MLSLVKLQWGRDQLIAEIFLRPAAFTGDLYASMGPRSIDRGNAKALRMYDEENPGFNGAAIN